MLDSEHASDAPISGFVVGVTVLLGLFMTVTGIWGLLAPGSFAQAANFPLGEHFVKDAGAFKLGIGATLFAALRWRKGLVVALLGYLVSNTIHMVNHIADLRVGGRPWEPWFLAFLSVLTLVAVFVRVRGTAASEHAGRSRRSQRD